MEGERVELSKPTSKGFTDPRVFPIPYPSKGSQGGDLNPHKPHYKCGVLPLNYPGWSKGGAISTPIHPSAEGCSLLSYLR